MGTKELLECFKHSLEQENRHRVKSDDYLEEAIMIAANVKRIYYIELAIEQLDKEWEESNNQAIIKMNQKEL